MNAKKEAKALRARPENSGSEPLSPPFVDSSPPFVEPQPSRQSSRPAMRPIRLGQFFPQTLGNGFFFRVFRVFRGFTRTLKPNQAQSNPIKPNQSEKNNPFHTRQRT
jgi:hypothetical protein